jgi:hypothetical protein
MPTDLMIDKADDNFVDRYFNSVSPPSSPKMVLLTIVDVVSTFMISQEDIYEEHF